MASGNKPSPWYKLKFPRDKYLTMGDPEPLRSEDPPKHCQGWKEISEEKYDMWPDSMSVVLQKDKKREYLMQYTKPTRMENGKFCMEIEMLHVDRRGFTYYDEASDPTVLQRNFWPVVEQLLAHYFAPKLRLPAPVTPPIPNEVPAEDEEEEFYQQAMGRFQEESLNVTPAN